jgi:hypothetical protein
VTRLLPENRSRSTRARSYVVGGVLARQALRALAQRKGRTALTALSIAIRHCSGGVGGGGSGRRASGGPRRQLAALGKGLVWI